MEFIPDFEGLSIRKNCVIVLDVHESEDPIVIRHVKNKK